MMRVPYNVKTESLALGRRFIAKSFTGAKQTYTMKAEDALAIGELRDAKAFARTWAERLGTPFSVWQGDKRVFSVRSY